MFSAEKICTVKDEYIENEQIICQNKHKINTKLNLNTKYKNKYIGLKRCLYLLLFYSHNFTALCKDEVIQQISYLDMLEHIEARNCSKCIKNYHPYFLELINVHDLIFNIEIKRGRLCIFPKIFSQYSESFKLVVQLPLVVSGVFPPLSWLYNYYKILWYTPALFSWFGGDVS